ncbi:hypothetical protein C8J56DRAFT_885430 [Mycena floridula]|nr:hypothetical protein C8J56DRAFT_885430 [Mycena floridula]
MTLANIPLCCPHCDGPLSQFVECFGIKSPGNEGRWWTDELGVLPHELPVSLALFRGRQSTLDDFDDSEFFQGRSTGLNGPSTSTSRYRPSSSNDKDSFCQRRRSASRRMSSATVLCTGPNCVRRARPNETNRACTYSWCKDCCSRHVYDHPPTLPHKNPRCNVSAHRDKELEAEFQRQQQQQPAFAFQGPFLPSSSSTTLLDLLQRVNSQAPLTQQQPSAFVPALPRIASSASAGPYARPLEVGANLNREWAQTLLDRQWPISGETPVHRAPRTAPAQSKDALFVVLWLTDDKKYMKFERPYHRMYHIFIDTVIAPFLEGATQIEYLDDLQDWVITDRARQVVPNSTLYYRKIGVTVCESLDRALEASPLKRRGSPLHSPRKKPTWKTSSPPRSVSPSPSHRPRQSKTADLAPSLGIISISTDEDEDEANIPHATPSDIELDPPQSSGPSSSQNSSLQSFSPSKTSGSSSSKAEINKKWPPSDMTVSEMFEPMENIRQILSVEGTETTQAGAFANCFPGYRFNGTTFSNHFKDWKRLAIGQPMILKDACEQGLSWKGIRHLQQ